MFVVVSGVFFEILADVAQIASLSDEIDVRATRCKPIKTDIRIRIDSFEGTPPTGSCLDR